MPVVLAYYVVFAPLVDGCSVVHSLLVQTSFFSHDCSYMCWLSVTPGIPVLESIKLQLKIKLGSFIHLERVNYLSPTLLNIYSFSFAEVYMDIYFFWDYLVPKWYEFTDTILKIKIRTLRMGFFLSFNKTFQVDNHLQFGVECHTVTSWGSVTTPDSVSLPSTSEDQHSSCMQTS